MTTTEMVEELGITKGCICKSLEGLRNVGMVKGERLFDLETRSFIYVHWLKTERRK